jgi:hypothetical protein
MVEPIKIPPPLHPKLHRVAREVGTDGKLGDRPIVPGVGGTWKDLTTR